MGEEKIDTSWNIQNRPIVWMGQHRQRHCKYSWQPLTSCHWIIANGSRRGAINVARVSVYQPNKLESVCLLKLLSRQLFLHLPGTEIFKVLKMSEQWVEDGTIRTDDIVHETYITNSDTQMASQEVQKEVLNVYYFLRVLPKWEDDFKRKKHVCLIT